jgi:hypothetical protein
MNRSPSRSLLGAACALLVALAAAGSPMFAQGTPPPPAPPAAPAHVEAPADGGHGEHMSEANLVIPDMTLKTYVAGLNGRQLLMLGLIVCVAGLVFGLVIYKQLEGMPVHQSMLDVSELIYETCKTYLITQGKFIAVLWAFIAVIMAVYFGVLRADQFTPVKTLIIIIFSIIGILGSYGVAWFGIRINTFANSRTAFASLQGKPFPTYAIPLKAGMSIGMLLISVELILMLSILLFVPPNLAGPASSASRSVSRSARPRCASPAASSRRSPTSARTS